MVTIITISRWHMNSCTIDFEQNNAIIEQRGYDWYKNRIKQQLKLRDNINHNVYATMRDYLSLINKVNKLIILLKIIGKFQNILKFNEILI